MTKTVSQTLEEMQGFIAKAAGDVFTSEAEKKQAMRQLSSGFKSGRDAMLETIWAAQREAGRESEEYERLNLIYWELPSELHQWREKHAAPVLALDPELSKVVEVFATLLARREAIKAAEIQRKTAKRDQPIQPGDRTQERGHCQLCGRDHAVRGFVAQHGYTVKHGFFNGVCPGHSYRPMEQDRTHTDLTANLMRKKAAEKKAQAERFATGEEKPRDAKESSQYRAKTIPFAEASEAMQKEAVETVVSQLRMQARALMQAADELQSLASKFHGQPLRTVKV